MKVRSSKKRKATKASGEAVEYQLRIYCCKACRKIHTELPSDLAPRKRHEAEAIQSALDGDGGHAAEGATVRRWRVGYMAWLAERIGEQLAALRMAGGRWLAAALREIYSGCAKHTRSAYPLRGDTT